MITVSRRLLLMTVLPGGILLASVAALLLAYFGAGVPVAGFEAQRTAWQSSQSWLLDRDGVPLQALRSDFSVQRDDWVALPAISPALLAAVLQVEDRRFRSHGGVDARALFAAGWQGLRAHDLQGQSLRGASTISMQLAAQLVPGASVRNARRNLRVKLTQMHAAWALERRWSKDEILEAYLNRVSFRGELQGIGAAARVLFHKSPAGLSSDEALLLAVMISSPNTTAARLAMRACARRPAGDCAALDLLAQSALRRGADAPLQVGPGLAPALARLLLHSPGERLRSTVSADLQRRAGDSLRRQLLGLSNSNVRDGAVVVLDNASGELLAYVGSAGPQSTAAQVDGARALRQAGSTLKPFLYALAFEKRYLTPASLLDDSPLNLQTAAGLYIPQNYDRQFKGVVSARSALAASLNIPAVRTLVLVGVEAFRDRLASLGYSDIDRDGEYYGYSLALGAAEVTLLQQANAYRMLANGGVASPVRMRVATAATQVAPRRVLPQAAAFLVTDILSDSAARAATFGLDSALATPFWTAVKTGTSKDLRDNWCIGYSARFTVAVWVGNFEGDSMRDVSGVTGAAPVWLDIMRDLHARTPSTPPPVPPGIVATQVSFAPPVEPARREYFLAGTQTARVELLAAADAAARIVSPANGALVALDPDIPPHNQRVLFQSRHPDAALQFWLDGRAVGSAAGVARWAPRPGSHRLELRSADGRIRDAVRFAVRGPP
jgi:penicillin-binding protein 1C